MNDALAAMLKKIKVATPLFSGVRLWIMNTMMVLYVIAGVATQTPAITGAVCFSMFYYVWLVMEERQSIRYKNSMLIYEKALEELSSVVEDHNKKVREHNAKLPTDSEVKGE